MTTNSIPQQARPVRGDYASILDYAAAIRAFNGLVAGDSFVPHAKPSTDWAEREEARILSQDCDCTLLS